MVHIGASTTPSTVVNSWTVILPMDCSSVARPAAAGSVCQPPDAGRSRFSSVRPAAGTIGASGCRGEAEPGVPVAGPAPADLGGAAPLPSVPAGAVAQPQGRRPGVQPPVRLPQPGADRHEAAVPLQLLRLLQQPVHALGEDE